MRNLTMRRGTTGRRTATAGLTCAVLLVAAACGGGDDKASESSAPTEMTIITPVAAAVNLSPIYLALSQGYWANENLDAKITVTTSGTATAIAAVVSGSAFSGCSGTSSAVPALQEKAPLKLAALLSYGNSGVLMGTKDFLTKAGITPTSSLSQRAKALEGARVGVFGPTSVTQQLVEILLTEQGITKDKVTFVELKNAAGEIGALQHGSVDVISIAEDQGSPAVEQGAVMFLRFQDELDVVKRLPAYSCFVKSDAESRQPDVLKGFIKGIEQALAYIESDPDGAHDAVLASPGFEEVSRPLFDTQWKAFLDGVSTHAAFTSADFDVLTEYTHELKHEFDVEYADAVVSAGA